MGRSVAAVLLAIFAVAFSNVLLAQNPPSRDPQALAALQQAIAAMGGSAPSDSTATGTITTTAGSLTESGAFVVLARGTDQTSEQILTAHGATTVYSQGNASQVQGTTVASLPLELAVTAQCVDFPLPLLIGVLNNSDSAFVYVGLESLNGVSVHHVQFWNSFTSVPQLAVLATFSKQDIWIDASSNLPLRISYNERAGQGAVPAVPFTVTFSNYTNVSGVLYPLSIQKSRNGTPWATIMIQNVVLNTGLTGANFPVN